MEYIATYEDADGTDGKLPILNMEATWIPAIDHVHIETGKGRVTLPLHDESAQGLVEGGVKLETLDSVINRLPANTFFSIYKESERPSLPVPDYMKVMRDEILDEYKDVLSKEQMADILVDNMKKKHGVTLSVDDAIEGLTNMAWRKKPAFWDENIKVAPSVNQSAKIVEMYNEHKSPASFDRAFDLLMNLPGGENPNVLMERIGRFVSTTTRLDDFTNELNKRRNETSDPTWLPGIMQQARRANNVFRLQDEVVRDLGFNVGQMIQGGNNYATLSALVEVFTELEEQKEGRGQTYAHAASFNKNQIDLPTIKPVQDDAPDNDDNTPSMKR
jgi:hypothetical protein